MRSGVEKGYIGNEWANAKCKAISLEMKSLLYLHHDDEEKYEDLIFKYNAIIFSLLGVGFEAQMN